MNNFKLLKGDTFMISFIKKFFYPIMFILSIISFSSENKLMQFFVVCVALVISVLEIKFGEKQKYTKKEIIWAIKKIFEIGFKSVIILIFFIGVIFCLTKNIKQYTNHLYIIFFSAFALFYKLIFKKSDNLISSVINYVFKVLEHNFLVWCILSSILISKKNFYLSEGIIPLLITIFSFLPPIVSLINKEEYNQKKIIKYTIFLLINLLCLIVFKEINIQNFKFNSEQEKLVPFILSLINLLCTSFAYFYIIQITYLSSKFCMKISNKN